MDATAPYAPPKAEVPVVILCGGMGTRIREASEKLPKPLIEIGGKPILWHIMKIYAAHGFRRFVLPLGYKGHLIREFFLNYANEGRDLRLDLAGETSPTWYGAPRSEHWEVTLVETGLETGTGARIKRVERYLDQPYFLMTYGDGIGNVDLDELYRRHVAGRRVATVTGVHPTSRFGEMQVAAGRVTEFNEKPTSADGWVSGGFFAYKREMVYRYLDDDPGLLLEKKPLRTLAADGELDVFTHEGFWMGMDTYRDWKELNDLWDAGEAQWKVWS